MSQRPGYDDLVSTYGSQIADTIIDSAEHCSDSAHVAWPDALRWAIDRHNNPDPPELVEQQRINAALADELAARRPDAVRPITYLEGAINGSAFDYPERLAMAERVFDERGFELGEGWQMSAAIKWANKHAARLAD